MHVILQQTVERLGERGARVRVADGYARNYLFPRGLAAPATESMMRRVAAEQQAVNGRLAKERAHVESIRTRLEQHAITIPVAAGADDKLFGSVTNAHIAAALTQAGFDVDKRKIALDAPLTALGVYQLPIKLHPSVTATVNVSIVKQP